MDFDKLCMVFTMQEPYYGILLSAMNKIPTNKVPTVGVALTGNVFTLLYNPDFVGQYSDDDILLFLKHETLHVAFNHFSLFDDVEINETTDYLQNVAEDMEVNCYINFPPTSKLHPLLPSKYGWDKELGSREYYKRLINMNQQQKANAQNPNKPCNGGQGGVSLQQSNSQSNNQPQEQGNGGQQSDMNASSNPGNNSGSENNQQSQQQSQTPNGLSKELSNLQTLDDHSMWPDEDQMSPEQITQIIEDLVVFAAEEVEKAHGTIPGEMVGLIDNIRNRRPKPAADWKRYFRRYIGNEFSEWIRKSKKRESRRFPDAAGNRHRRKSHILVAIDTSGSVSMPEYREFFAQIKTLTKDADFHVVECDAAIQHEYDYKGHPNLVLHGHGGTAFEPVIDLYLRDRRKYDALVYFTDGESGIPKNTPKDTLWVISSKGDHNKEKYKVNGASVVIIPEQKKA